MTPKGPFINYVTHRVRGHGNFEKRSLGILLSRNLLVKIVSRDIFRGGGNSEFFLENSVSRDL